MTRHFITNADGTCVTPAGLDAFWPEDDRPVDMTSAAFKLFSGGKGGHALPTCDPGAMTTEQQFIAAGGTHEAFMAAVFPSDPLPAPGSLPSVPLDASAVYLIGALLIIALTPKGPRR